MTEEKYDTRCPFVKLMGEDLVRTTEAYFRCQANCRGMEFSGEYDQNMDYYKCDSENHKGCLWYLQESKLEKDVKDD